MKFMLLIVIIVIIIIVGLYVRTTETFVSQGHGVPLLYESHTTEDGDNSMFYFKNHECRPECCGGNGSQYSCTNGCVCMGPPKDFYQPINNGISPRS